MEWLLIGAVFVAGLLPFAAGAWLLFKVVELVSADPHETPAARPGLYRLPPVKGEGFSRRHIGRTEK